MMEMTTGRLGELLATMVQDFINDQPQPTTTKAYRLTGNLKEQYFFTLNVKHDPYQHTASYTLELTGKDAPVTPTSRNVNYDELIPDNDRTSNKHSFDEATSPVVVTPLSDSATIEQFEATIYMYIMINNLRADEVVWIGDTIEG